MYSYYFKPKKEAYHECVKLSIPLLIRLLEYAHETATGDIELHHLLERIIKYSGRDKVLDMSHYEELVPHKETENNPHPR